MCETTRLILEKCTGPLSPQLVLKLDNLCKQSEKALDRDDYTTAYKCGAAAIELLFAAGVLAFPPASIH